MQVPKAPMAEHIRNDSPLEVARLLRESRGKAGDPVADANYREALGMAGRLSRSSKPKQLLELHDVLKGFPHSDFGDEGGKLFESLRDELIEAYRRKVNVLTGWAFE